MESSQELKDLSKSFCSAQAEFSAIPLDSTVKVALKSGGSYTFGYASLPNILSAVKPVLFKHGLAITQFVGKGDLVTRLIHASGQFISETTELPFREAMTMQERGSVISYMRRYTIVCLLGIVGDEDDDANGADGNGFQKAAAPAKATPPPPPSPPPAPKTSKADVNAKPPSQRLADMEALATKAGPEKLNKFYGIVNVWCKLNDKDATKLTEDDIDALLKHIAGLKPVTKKSA